MILGSCQRDPCDLVSEWKLESNTKDTPYAAKMAHRRVEMGHMTSPGSTRAFDLWTRLQKVGAEVNLLFIVMEDYKLYYGASRFRLFGEELPFLQSKAVFPRP